MEYTTDTRKKSKKKLLIILLLLLLLVVASVITTVVLVLAAGQQNVNSNVNVNYTVTDVSATVSAKYGICTAEVLADMTTDGAAPKEDRTNASYTFLPNNDGLTPLSLKPQKNHTTYANGTVTLTSGAPFAVFEYKFVNNSDDIQINVSLNYVDDHTTDEKYPADKNIVAGYFTSTDINGISMDAIETVKRINAGTKEEPNMHWDVAGDAFVINDLTESVATDTVVCDGSGTLYFYVVVMIDSLNSSATFSGDFNFLLSAKSND